MAFTLVSFQGIGEVSPQTGLASASPTEVADERQGRFVNAWSGGNPTILLPEADAYVRGGAFADDNFGGETRLTVKRASPSYSREAFLRFDPSVVTGTITSAMLELAPLSVGPEALMTNEAALVLDDTWNEHTMSWNTRPVSSTVLGSWTPVEGLPVTLDVTYQLKTALREGKKISLSVYSPNELSPGAWVHYGSRENSAATRPRLVVNTVAMLYPSTPDESSWDSGHWSDGSPRIIPRSGDGNDPTGWSQKRGTGELAVDGQGTLTMQGPEPRIYLNGVPDKFWKNVEATVYYKRVQDDGTPWGGLVMGARSGPNGHTTKAPCTATTYHGRLRHDGKVDFEKELKHPEGEVRESKAVWNGGPLPSNRWIGLKFVVYNVDNDSKVKLELYRDLTEGFHGGRWEKLAEYTDAGGWGSAEGCGYSQDHIITNGGGVVFIRNTGVQEAQYKWFSVREIALP